MFGALFGDVIGSYYEVHCTKDVNFPFESESTFTDDSVMTAAVCQTILNDPSEIGYFGISDRAKQFAGQYRRFYSYFPYAGFGNMFSEWAKAPTAKKQHSYANGAAMRVAPLAYAYNDLKQLAIQVRASCIPTHAHRIAIKGAQAVAASVFLARTGHSKDEIKKYIEDNFYDLSEPIASIREHHVFDSKSSYSVPPAIQAFLESTDYESAVRNAVSLGGDADTQACIAGAIAEAYYKEIPKHIRDFCYPRIDMTIKAPVREFCDKYGIAY